MDNNNNWSQNRRNDPDDGVDQQHLVPSQVTTSDEKKPQQQQEQKPALKKRVSYKNSSLAISDHFQKQYLHLSRHSSSGGDAFDEGVDDDDLSTDHTSRTGGHMETVVDMIQQLRYRCGVFVNLKSVQFFIVCLIAINAIMMGIGTFDFVKENPKVQYAFETVDLVFLIIFTVELGMQFIFYGWRLLLDGWLLFDTIIITMSWLFSEIQIIRAFRIFRAFRLITRIKVLKNLVLALFGVMPRMFAIGLLLMLVSYIFAVMFTQLFKDLYEEGLTDEDYFGRLDNTLFSLFQIMTLDSWADIARQVMDVYSWAWLPFITFVIITGFVVVNLIIAVICDAISALRDEERAKLHGTYEEEDSEGSEDDFAADDNEPNEDSDDVRVQLDALEDQVDELARMQEESLLALEQLTRQLQAQRGILAAPPMVRTASMDPPSKN